MGEKWIEEIVGMDMVCEAKGGRCKHGPNVQTRICIMSLEMASRGCGDAHSKFYNFVRGFIQMLLKSDRDGSFRQLFQAHYEKIHIPISCKTQERRSPGDGREVDYR